MPQKISPFTEGLYGWNLGESGWNTGMDSNILRFSFLFDANLTGLVDTLPSPIVNGRAYYLTTDKRLYFAVGGSWYSTNLPDNFIVKIKATGQFYQMVDGELTPVVSPNEASSQLESINVTLESLGSAAFEDASYFATKLELEDGLQSAREYTDGIFAGGADEIGWTRKTLSEQIASVNSVGFALSTKAVTPWEFYSLITDKPDPTNPATWDWHPAIQAAVDSGQSVFIPAGTYYSSQTIRTTHTGSYFRADSGQVIFGAGIKTRLTRNSTAPASAAEANYKDEAFFSIHGSNFEVSSLYFEDCSIAIYFGQDPRQATEGSHTSFNRLRNLWISNCGTGILSACSQGHYYNTYESIHIAQCQIGIKFQAGARWASSVDNNNRNTFLNVRSSRCWVGMWLENGDTNGFYGFHCEGNNGTPVNNRYVIPAGLPSSVANYGGVTLPAITTAGAFLVKGSNNNFFGCVTETCDWTLWNEGVSNSYQNCLLREDVSATTAVRCVVAPVNFVTRSTTWLNGGDIVWLTNQNSYAFPGIPAGRLVNSAVLGVRVVARRELAVAKGSADPVREFVLDLGSVASGGTATFPLWVSSVDERGCSCGFEIIVEGNNQSGSTMHSTKIGGVAGRNSAGTLTRYYSSQISNFRATGAGSGDTAEPFTAALSVSGSDLQVTLTAPARAFSSVKVFVRLIMSKA